MIDETATNRVKDANLLRIATLRASSETNNSAERRRKSPALRRFSLPILIREIAPSQKGAARL